MAAKTSSKSTKRSTKSTPPPAPAATVEKVVETKAVETKAVAVETRTPSAEEIQRRAFELFVARGRQHGRAQEDWLTAERELRTRYAIS